MAGTAYDFVSPPAPDALSRAGADLVFLYAQESRWPGSEWVNDVLARGIGIILIWERGTLDSHGGYQSGVRDAQRAEAFAASVGYPARATMFYNLGDTNSHGADGYETVIADYVRGIRSVNPGRLIGGYGPGRAFAELDGVFRWVPETWNPGPADVVQIANSPSPLPNTDINVLHNVGMPQWGGHGGPTIPGDDNELNDIEKKQLSEVHAALVGKGFGADIQSHVLATSKKVEALHNAFFNKVYGVDLQSLIIAVYKKVLGR